MNSGLPPGMIPDQISDFFGAAQTPFNRRARKHRSKSKKVLSPFEPPLLAPLPFGLNLSQFVEGAHLLEQVFQLRLILQARP